MPINDTNKLHQQLNEYLTTSLPEITAFCAKLLQIPSVNNVHNEVDVARLITAQAEALGLQAQMMGKDPQRPNVIVSTAETGPTGLLLVGHLDTVPAGDPAQWSHPPFAGKISGSKLFGRGAIDNKGGIAAALYALAALAKTEGALSQGRAQFIGVPDEESGATGSLGVKYLSQHNLLEGLGAIYVYPGMAEIPLGHRGLVRFELTALGQATHTGSTGWQAGHTTGCNAVTGLADLLLQLEQIVTPFSQIPYFDKFRAVITPGTMIDGGTAINIVPDHCRALIDVRTIPEFGLTEAEAAVNEAIQTVVQRRPGLKFKYTLLNHLPPAISDDSASLFAILENVVQDVKGVIPPRIVAGPANEGYLFIEQGMPIVCGFGPSGANAHAIDEYVEIDSLAEAALIYCLTAQKMADQL